LTWVLKEKWLWITILALIVIGGMAFVIIWAILLLPTEGKVIATFLILIGWGVAAGYKEWVQHKREEQRPE